MIGVNKVTLNQAAMVKALQQWVDTTFSEGHRQTVTAVEADKGAVYGDNSFVITLGDADRPGPRP